VLFRHLGVRGLALTHSLSYVVAAVLTGAVLARRIGGLEGAHTLAELAKAVAATAAATAAMLAVRAGVQGALAAGGSRAVAEVVAAGTSGAVVFPGAARAPRAEDLVQLARLLPGRLQGRLSP
jgi:peptidoglycan biosynthesis protein MviN/MurJ (putative lipid II flippase)